MKNALNWFEIPATDIKRATNFYSTILNVRLEIGEMNPGFLMAMLPVDEGTVGGAIVQGESYVPSSTEGSLIWLNGGADLNVVLDRVEGAGGQVIMPKTSITVPGMAMKKPGTMTSDMSMNIPSTIRAIPSVPTSMHPLLLYSAWIIWMLYVSF